VLRRALDGAPPLRAWGPDTVDLPWSDADFSERMLAEHLDQDHDAASRRLGIVEQQVTWLAGHLSLGAGSSLLDLACGPGLHARGFGQLGVAVTGVDVAPAAIREARARCVGLPCTFVRADIREFAVEPASFDAAIVLYGQLAVARPDDVPTILTRIRRALRPGGRLALELADVARLDRSLSRTVTSGSGGLWGEGEHVIVHERAWDDDAEAIVERHHVLDVSTGRVERYGVSERAYDEALLGELLGAEGFRNLARDDSWLEIAPDVLSDWILWRASAGTAR